MTGVDNLFGGIPARLPDELVEALVRTGAVRLERIVSLGHITPAGQWLEQAQDEWVALLRGSARLAFEGEAAPITLRPGDHLVIPARQRHRVEWTDPTDVTVWLALHY
jgi:cupin 2 domain-containing protein